jgi:hypothetical protein
VAVSSVAFEEVVMTQFSLAQQIEEVEREIAMRERVYPHQVRSGKLRQSIADYQMNRMLAVLETLRRLQDGEHNAGNQ